MGKVTDGFSDLQGAIDAVDAEREGLDAQFEDARSLIEEQYRLSETDREREQLESLLNDLSDQREQAEAQLAVGYNRARQNVLGRLEDVTGAAPEAVERAASDFESAYSAVRDSERRAADEASMDGIPVNIGGGPTSGAGERVQSAGADARQATMGREEILQDDLGWLADTLQAEGQAQVGETQRLGQRMSAAAQRSHNQQVNERIQQERMAQAQQLGQLQSQFTGRGFQLGDSERQLMSQLGQMRQQAGESAAQRALQRDEGAAQRALQRELAARSGGGGGGGRRSGGGGGGGSGGPTAVGVDPSGLQTDSELRSQMRTYANRALNDPGDFPDRYQSGRAQRAPSSGAGRSQVR